MANAREGAPRRTKEEIREARAKQARRERARRRRRARAIRRVIGRSFLVLITVVVLAVAAVFGVATVLAYGPSGTLSDWLVMSTLETSAAKFVIVGVVKVIVPANKAETALCVVIPRQFNCSIRNN